MIIHLSIHIANQSNRAVVSKIQKRTCLLSQLLASSGNFKLDKSWIYPNLLSRCFNGGAWWAFFSHSCQCGGKSPSLMKLGHPAEKIYFNSMYLWCSSFGHIFYKRTDRKIELFALWLMVSEAAPVSHYLDTLLPVTIIDHHLNLSWEGHDDLIFGCITLSCKLWAIHRWWCHVHIGNITKLYFALY